MEKIIKGMANASEAIDNNFEELSQAKTSHDTRLTTVEQKVDLLKGAKIEYVNIPANEKLVRSIPNQTSVLIALSANNDDFAFVALLTRFGAADSGYVQTVIRDHSSINIASNASRTSCFITPVYSARGMIITVNP